MFSVPMSRQKRMLSVPTAHILWANMQVLEMTTKREKTTLAKNIIAKRKSLGWSQTMLAEKAKIGVNTVKSIELGISHGQPATKEAIAKALGCTPDDLQQRETLGMRDLANPDKMDKILSILERRQLAEFAQERELERLRTELEIIKSHPAWKLFQAAEKAESWQLEEALEILRYRSSHDSSHSDPKSHRPKSKRGE